MSFIPLNKILRISFFIAFVVLFTHCATYNGQITPYYHNAINGDYIEANEHLDKIRPFKKKRNKLLYFMEKGKITHLMGQYDTSNYYFNQADQFIENFRTEADDIISGTLINPMMQTYGGEDFEKFMIHYYKALNYIYLNNTEDALVEARRISLRTQQQSDKFDGKENSYSKDAFSLLLQGIIYEKGNDINNAFIAYRNAVEVYLSHPDSIYYGVKIPHQLKKDVIRTAYLNGFYDEYDRFQRIFGMNEHYDVPNNEGGELILFWENGLAPIKDQEGLFFTMYKNEGEYYFSDRHGNIIPFHSGVHLSDQSFNPKNLDIFYIAFPKYVAQPLNYTSASIAINSGTDSIVLEKVEDINTLAFESLRQRYLQEISLALSRMAVKKIAAYLIQSKENDSKSKKDKRDGIATLLIELYYIFSEKADTRNWQTLPENISYARIPLKKGRNDITVKINNKDGVAIEKKIEMEGTGNLKLYNLNTFK